MEPGDAAPQVEFGIFRIDPQALGAGGNRALEVAEPPANDAEREIADRHLGVEFDDLLENLARLLVSALLVELLGLDEESFGLRRLPFSLGLPLGFRKGFESAEGGVGLRPATGPSRSFDILIAGLRTRGAGFGRIARQRFFRKRHRQLRSLRRHGRRRIGLPWRGWGGPARTKGIEFVGERVVLGDSLR